jgi:hypothetical protein
MNSFYVANDTVVIFDRAIFTGETGKEEGWKFKNCRSGLGRLVRSPFYKQINDRPAYGMMVNDRPDRTLYFSRETRKEEGEKVINTMTIINNDNFKNRKNKAAIDYWPGK